MTKENGSTGTTVIRARRGWAGLGLRELVDYHELLYFLVWRDLKVRYKQTAFGVAWALLQPLLLMLILTLFLGRMSGIAPVGIPYPVFVLAGLVPWTLFGQGLAGAANSLVEGAPLLSKVYFPRLIFPLAATGSHVVDFGMGLGLLLIVSTLSGFGPAPAWLALIPFALLAVLAALASGLWLSALNVRYRDFRYAIPFLIQLWFFATPVAYGLDAIPESLSGLLALNPMTGVVEGFRWALTSGAAGRPDVSILISSGASVVILVGGLAFFRRVERTFADVI